MITLVTPLVDQNSVNFSPGRMVGASVVKYSISTLEGGGAGKDGVALAGNGVAITPTGDVGAALFARSVVGMALGTNAAPVGIAVTTSGGIGVDVAVGRAVGKT